MFSESCTNKIAASSCIVVTMHEAWNVLDLSELRFDHFCVPVESLS